MVRAAVAIAPMIEPRIVALEMLVKYSKSVTFTMSLFFKPIALCQINNKHPYLNTPNSHSESLMLLEIETIS